MGDLAQRALVLWSCSQSLCGFDRHPREAMGERIPERPVRRFGAYRQAAPVSVEQPRALPPCFCRECYSGIAPVCARPVPCRAPCPSMESTPGGCSNNFVFHIGHRSVHRRNDYGPFDYEILRIPILPIAGTVRSVLMDRLPHTKGAIFAIPDSFSESR